MSSFAQIASTPNRSLRLFLQIASVGMLISSGLYFALTWQWPLVGDASLIHYICFLMDHGMAPYRDLGDMNMPGSYLVEWAVMHTLGDGAIAWRIYDFVLMIAGAAAIRSITLPAGWFAGIFGATTFVLVHGRDGMAQGGQRDLTMAIALIVATAFLFKAVRRNAIWASALFGLFAGIAITIKPTALPFAGGLLAMAIYTLRRRTQPAKGIALASLCALAVGPMIAALFLWKQHAVRAFIDGLHSVVPYYASLGHRPLAFLLTHSVSPLLPLILLWLALLITVRQPLQWERAALMTGVAFGLISYVVQARGYPYYRYPLLVFLLPLMASDMTTLLYTNCSKLARAIAVTGIAVGAFVIAPMSARFITQYDWHNIDFISSLETNLNKLGGPHLSGQIQCIDSISGCGTTLYRMKLVQATGVLSDFLLFGPDRTPVIQKTREQFANEILMKPPKVIVVSSFLHIDGPDGYEKMSRWPEFRDFLLTRYCMVVDWSPNRPQHWWSRAQWPNGYRVYVLRGNSNSSGCAPAKMQNGL